MTLLVEVAEADAGERCEPYHREGHVVTCLGDHFLFELAHRAAGEMAVRFVKEKLQVETLTQTVKANSDVRNNLRMLIKRRKSLQDHPKILGLASGFGAEFMLALMGKGLPEWCWDGHAGSSMDNLLQYILKEIPLEPMNPEKIEAERKLCLELAKRFSLQDLCYQNRYRRTALYYADFFVGELQKGRWRVTDETVAAWMEVGDTIKQQMEVRVREFEGKLMELVFLKASVQDDLGKGALVLKRLGTCMPFH
eukprot:Skav218999  [mRNA]  locus=scaffold169:368085:368840:+ [translate_table: standard]